MSSRCVKRSHEADINGGGYRDANGEKKMPWKSGKKLTLNCARRNLCWVIVPGPSALPASQGRRRCFTAGPQAVKGGGRGGNKNADEV